MISSGNPITVLIIDDDDFTRQMAKEILKEKLSYTVLTAASGKEGVNMLYLNKVHLILLDVAMPIWDGFKTLSVLHEKELLKNIPVIMLTAAADRDSVIKASQYGVKDYIRKPFVPEELVSRVSKAIWENYQDESLDSLTLDLDDLLKNLGASSDDRY